MMENPLSEQTVSDILRGITIPAQPQILADLQIAQAMGSDMDEIGRLISKDISLSGSLLKVANSPFYGLSRPVTSVEQAIMMVGLAAVENIVIGISLRQGLIDRRRMSEDDISFLNRFWDSAEDMAKAASLISREIDMEDPDLLYTLGLFQNAGIPLLVPHFPGYRQVLIEAYGQNEHSLTHLEDARIKTNHAVLGYYLARSWKLPLFLCETIAEHHNLSFLFGNKKNNGSPMLNMLAILKLAEHLVGLHYVLGRHELDLEWMQLESEICHYLNLSTADIEDLRMHCEDIGIINQHLG